MFQGSQGRQRPCSPSNSIQQLTTRKGGSASATAAAAKKAGLHRAGRAASQSAARKPPPTAPIVAAPLTSRLFQTKVQFMRGLCLGRLWLFVLGRRKSREEQSF